MGLSGEKRVQYTTGNRCGIENCNAKRYYVEEGFTYCKNGHQQDIVCHSPKASSIEFSVTAIGRDHKPSEKKKITRKLEDAPPV